MRPSAAVQGDIFIENMLGERRRGKPNCQEAASRVHVRGAGADTGMSTNGWPENTLPCLEMAPLPGNDSTQSCEKGLRDSPFLWTAGETEVQGHKSGINVVSHCKSSSCRVARTSAWFC